MRQPDIDFLANEGHSGPFMLTRMDVDFRVRAAGPNMLGNYVVASFWEGNAGRWRVRRADRQPLADRLADYLGAGEYTRFWFKFAASAEAAHDQECVDFHHGFAPPVDNQNHPDLLDGSPRGCPVPGCRRRLVGLFQMEFARAGLVAP